MQNEIAKKSILEVNAFASKYFTAKCVSCKMPTDPRVIDDHGLCPACGGTAKWKPEYKYPY